MLDHISLTISDFARSRDFYKQALAPLGYSLLREVGPQETGGAHFAGFGRAGKPDFWVGDAGSLSGNVHVAFAAQDHETVKKFYEQALAAGGSDNGPPGLRPHYHPNYYAAFVLDPDGHNIEAVCHAPGTFEDQFPS